MIGVSDQEHYTLKDGRGLYPFQVTGKKFIESSNFRCQISDEMGLGKTIQAVAAINDHFEDLKPIIIVVKASLTYNWFKEILSGTGRISQIFESGDTLIPGVEIVLISFDTLSPRTRLNKKTGITRTDRSNLDKIIAYSPKTLIIDECQMMKNHEAKRTNAIRELVRHKVGEENSVKHIISLSGTPIKNNALEYFPILNLLRPEMFPSLHHFESNYVDYYWNGKSYKAGGIRNPERFLEKTSDFIIRRTRKEVLPDLPSITRDYKYYPLSDEVRKEYGKRVKDLSNFLDEERGTDFQVNLLAMLGILRHLTGLAKIEPTIEYTLDFIENDENHPKIVIFHHHIDVGDVVEIKLKELGIKTLRIKSSQDSMERENQIDQFRSNPDIPVLIIPTLAGGEGINLQFCSHAIIMEREWNPANEEQAEGRFSRIGSTSSSILVNYPVATGTIDEYFAEIVERKREIVGVSLDGKSDSWDHSSIMLELAEKVVNKWRM